MNYEQNKRLFKYILSKNYKITKDTNNHDILYIIFDTFEIKCKYFLLFSLIGNKLLWSCDNPYNELETNKLCKEIKNKIKHEKDIVKLTFNINETIVKLDWIIEDKKSDYSSFYAITEIVHF